MLNDPVLDPFEAAYILKEDEILHKFDIVAR